MASSAAARRSRRSSRGIDKAAAILYINRRTLYNKLQLHGIKKSFRSG